MRQLFGTDGIRGLANTYPMNVETAMALGKAVVHYFKRGRGDTAGQLMIGQDTRRSGDMLAQAVAAGACAAGADVKPLGVLPTPGIAYLARTADAMAGIVISASHNPFEDNGIKVFDGNGCKLSDAAEAAIEALMQQEASVAGSKEIGRVRPIPNAKDRYRSFLQQIVPNNGFENLSIVLDCANGATFEVAPEVFNALGVRVTALFCEPDGFNINDGCGSQHPEKLARTVVTQKADMGLAFDGDGDRLIAVDETGSILSGDQILAICAKHLMQKGALEKKIVVSTIMSNMGLGLALESLGIELLTTPVGDRYVMEKMRSVGAVLGGEDSGHMIFRNIHTTGDGIVAALNLLEAVRCAGEPISQLARVMTVFPQEMINVDVRSKPDIQSIPRLSHAIERIEKALGNQGRVLVRYSGTQNKCRVMVEGPTKELTHAYCVELADVVKQAIGS